MPPVYLEQGGGDPVLAALKDHDSQAPRISAAEEARTWVQLARCDRPAHCRSRRAWQEGPNWIRLTPLAAAARRQSAPFPRRQPALADPIPFLPFLHRFGYLATVENDSGFPNSSLVEFAADPKTGLPVLAVSTLSAHTADLAASGRASLTVATPRFAGLADGRVTLQVRMQGASRRGRLGVRRDCRA